MKLPPGSLLLGTLVFVVVVAVLTGLFLLGSPADERARRLDDRRVADLQRIAAAVDLYWTRHSRLPVSVDELTAEPGVRISDVDPASSVAYGYQPLDSTTYEVCAVFELESSDPSTFSASRLWAHGSGRYCFQLEAEEVTPNGLDPPRFGAPRRGASGTR